MTVVGVADDCRFIGPAQQALDAAQMYRDHNVNVTAAGHAFQTSKSWLFSHSQGVHVY